MKVGIIIVDHGSRRMESNLMLEEVARQFAVLGLFPGAAGKVATTLAMEKMAKKRK